MFDIIINPKGGKGKSLKALEQVEKILRGHGAEYTVHNTEYAGHATELARELSAKPDTKLIVMGGDGSFNEVLNGITDFNNVTLGIVACGTGNDFIRMFGDEKDRFFDLTELMTGEVRPIDIIRCNDRYAVNICSMGLDARVGTDVHKYSGIPVIGGAAGYVVSLIVNYCKGVSTPMTATVDGLTCGPELNIVCVCNGRFYGGGFNPTNDSRPDDGYMDVLIASGVNRAKLLGVIMSYAKAKYRQFPQYITYVRTRHLEVTCRNTEVINIDGEAEHSTKAVFDLIPGGINFIAPRNMRFFHESEA